MEVKKATTIEARGFMVTEAKGGVTVLEPKGAVTEVKGAVNSQVKVVLIFSIFVLPIIINYFCL